MQYHDAVRKLSEQTGAEPVEVHENGAQFDGHLRIYPTLACNLGCGYCVNEQMGQRPHAFPRQPAGQWVEAINREGRHVVLTGGEPFLVPDLPELINGVTASLKVRVYSNFCLELKDMLAAITRPVHFYISWHPQKRADRDIFLANVLAMRTNPLFTADIHAIDALETRPALDRDLDFFASHGLTLDKDADQRTFDGACQPSTRTAACSKTIYLIGPDGTRFQCVSRMMRNDRPMENMLQGPLDDPEAASVCPDFGNCAPCDILGQTKMAVF